ncbi:MAG: xylan 1,4-beta-xylosidase [Clostridia bacterium]|nr:xylan 1,4-beta-xylosidase [Clostridia bacterium]
MAKKKDVRFEKVYSQGKLESVEIWRDTETGVNYVFRVSGYAGGLTPLLDSEGKIVVTKSEES